MAVNELPAADAGHLLALYQAGPERDLEVAIQLGRDRSLPEGLLVDVHDLGLAQAGYPALEVQGRQAARAGRVGGIDRGMDLDPGRDAESGQILADGPVDVPGGAIPAGKEQEIDAGALHLPGSLPGVLCRGCPRYDSADDRGLKAAGPGCILPHLARIGDELQIRHRSEPFQSLRRRGLRPGAQRPVPAPSPGSRLRRCP